MLDYMLDPDDNNDEILADKYVSWVEGNYTFQDVESGNCPSFEVWLESLGEGDSDPDVDDEDKRVI